MANAFSSVSRCPIPPCPTLPWQRPRSLEHSCEPTGNSGITFSGNTSSQWQNQSRDSNFPLFNLHIHVPLISLYWAKRDWEFGLKTCRVQKSPLPLPALAEAGAWSLMRTWTVRYSRTGDRQTLVAHKGNLRLGRYNKSLLLRRFKHNLCKLKDQTRPSKIPQGTQT